MSAEAPDQPRSEAEVVPLRLAAVPASSLPPLSLPPSSQDDDTRSIVKGLIKTVRPHQWVKSVFVLAPVFFAKDLVTTTPGGDPALNLHLAGHALAAMAVFCLLAGAVYTLNDLVDIEADRVHPVKRLRPIASGIVPARTAQAMVVALVLTSLGLAYLLEPWFALAAVVYFAENILYSFKLKNVAFVDVSMIATFFGLRVWAGGLATGVHVSGYMYACTGFIALFLGFGKRRHELGSENAGKQRAALKAYTTASLDVALALTGSATIVAYIAYTLDPTTVAFFRSSYLWLTAPFVAFALGRFLFLVSGRTRRGMRAESPTQEMLGDVPFVLDVVAWVVIIVAIVYHLRPGT